MIAVSVRMERKARKNHIQQTHTHIHTQRKREEGGRLRKIQTRSLFLSPSYQLQMHSFQGHCKSFSETSPWPSSWQWPGLVLSKAGTGPHWQRSVLDSCRAARWGFFKCPSSAVLAAMPDTGCMAIHGPHWPVPWHFVICGLPTTDTLCSGLGTHCGILIHSA